jgi:uncharacterized membrane protein
VARVDLRDAITEVSVGDAVISDIPLVVNVAGSADVTVASNAADLTFTGPFNWSNTKTAGATTLGFSSLLHDDLTLAVTTLTLGVDPLTVENDTRAILNPIFDVLDDSVLDPLLSALGLSLGGGDVTAWDLRCHTRVLANQLTPRSHSGRKGIPPTDHPSLRR